MLIITESRRSSILNLGFAKPTFSQSGAFHEMTGIKRTMKTTQTATNKGVDCWIGANHRNHGNDEKHETPGCKTQVPQN